MVILVHTLRCCQAHSEEVLMSLELFLKTDEFEQYQLALSKPGFHFIS